MAMSCVSCVILASELHLSRRNTTYISS
uniref:Uncharacterized protein n=1 Tax=Anguilla anguilla TaxID=7936 RepID=A0A0E9QBF8_ANGAN